MALILLVMFVGDHPRVLPAYRHQTVILDRALSGDAELRSRLEEVLQGTVHAATVQQLDLVNDKTVVDVRFAYRPASAIPTAATPAPAARYRAGSGTAGSPLTGSHGELPPRELAPVPAGAL